MDLRSHTQLATGMNSKKRTKEDIPEKTNMKGKTNKALILTGTREFGGPSSGTEETGFPPQRHRTIRRIIAQTQDAVRISGAIRKMQLSEDSDIDPYRPLRSFSLTTGRKIMIFSSFSEDSGEETTDRERLHGVSRSGETN